MENLNRRDVGKASNGTPAIIADWDFEKLLKRGSKMVEQGSTKGRKGYQGCENVFERVVERVVESLLERLE